MKTTLTLLCIAALAIGVGCASLSEYVTPANIDKQAVTYAASAGVADVNDYAGYANLEKAIRLEVAVENAYEVKTLALAQMQEKNQLDYGILRGVVTGNTKLARAREERLFGETGLLSVGLAALGMGGLGGIVGLMRKRPKDWSSEEVERALAEVKGSVSDKDRQLIEVVKGVQSFINTNPGEAADGLKAAITAARSSDTAQAIATIKATLA